MKSIIFTFLTVLMGEEYLFWKRLKREEFIPDPDATSAEELEQLTKDTIDIVKDIRQPRVELERLGRWYRQGIAVGGTLVGVMLFLTFIQIDYTTSLFGLTVTVSQQAVTMLFYLGLSLLSISAVLYQLHKSNDLQMKIQQSEAAKNALRQINEEFGEAGLEWIEDADRLATFATMLCGTSKEDTEKEEVMTLLDAIHARQELAGTHFPQAEPAKEIIDNHWDDPDFWDGVKDAEENFRNALNEDALHLAFTAIMKVEERQDEIDIETAVQTVRRLGEEQNDVSEAEVSVAGLLLYAHWDRVVFWEAYEDFKESQNADDNHDDHD